MQLTTLELDSTPGAPGAVRDELGGLRRHLGRRFDDAVLVASELVSNAVRHGDSRNVRVDVVGADGMVRITVTDDGPCFGPRDERGDGMGLRIVERVAAAWGVDDADGCSVWAELALGV